MCVLWVGRWKEVVGGRDMSHISDPQEDQVPTKSMACHPLRAWISPTQGPVQGCGL